MQVLQEIRLLMSRCLAVQGYNPIHATVPKDCDFRIYRRPSPMFGRVGSAYGLKDCGWAEIGRTGAIGPQLKPLSWTTRRPRRLA